MVMRKKQQGEKKEPFILAEKNYCPPTVAQLPLLVILIAARTLFVDECEPRADCVFVLGLIVKFRNVKFLG